MIKNGRAEKDKSKTASGENAQKITKEGVPVSDKDKKGILHPHTIIKQSKKEDKK